MNDPAIVDPIPYATPSQASRPRVAPAVCIALIGLALIGLGGCFCIGIMQSLNPYMTYNGNTPTAPPMTPGVIPFIITLYAAAFSCFGGAVFLIQRGARLLLGLMK